MITCHAQVQQVRSQASAMASIIHRGCVAAEETRGAGSQEKVRKWAWPGNVL